MFPGVALHVIQRGNNRSVCFPAGVDYSHYLFQLARLAPVHGCVVHAYCLMPNHVHLLLTPTQAYSCARMMQRLGQLHAQYINDLYKRTGTLWEGRFKSSLVQSQAYVLACYRYIELNPVRASLVNHPSRYAWSSYGVNASGAIDSLLEPHAEYLALAQSRDARLAAYRQMVDSGLNAVTVEEIRTAATGGFALGGDKFKQDLSLSLGRRSSKGKAGRPRIVQEEAQDQDQLKMEL
jgi:putative transposase